MTQFAQELAAHTGRIREQKVVDRETPHIPSEEPRTHSSSLSDTFQTWRRIRFRDPVPLLLAPLAAAIFYALALSVPAFNQQLGWTLVHGIGAGGIGVFMLYLVFDFVRFRNWRSRLPFQLVGWAELVNGMAFSVGAWRHAELKLVFAPGTPADIEKRFAHALIVFAHRANNSYGERFTNDLRRYWGTNLLVAEGSINVAVTALFERLCRNKLTALALRFPNQLQRVELVLKGAPFVTDGDESSDS